MKLTHRKIGILVTIVSAAAMVLSGYFILSSVSDVAAVVSTHPQDIAKETINSAINALETGTVVFLCALVGVYIGLKVYGGITWQELLSG